MGSTATSSRMLRLLSIALMLASGSSFAPSLKTQLAARRPPPTPARAMPPDMAFQSPFEWRKNNDERRLREIIGEKERNRKHEELMAMQRLAFWTFMGVLLSFVL